MAEPRRARRGQVRVYDFRRPDRFSKEQLRALHLIHENVARTLGTTLSAFYRGLASVAVRDIHQQTYAEFIDALPNPGVVAVLAMPPLEGRMVVDLDPDLAFPVVDRMFGGPGESLGEPRALTDIEQVVIRRVFEAMARGIGEAWAPLAAVQPSLEALETNATFLQLMAPGEVVLAIELSAELAGHRGLIRLCLPLILLEPVMPRLSADHWFGTKQRQARAAELERHLASVEVQVAARLGRVTLRLGELMQLDRGDVIELGVRRDQPVVVLVEGQPAFVAQPGSCRGRLALRVLGLADGGETGVGA